MSTDEQIDLVRDIEAHGQREPIVIYEDQILDGRHRFFACRQLGIEPKMVVFTGSRDEARTLVWSMNVYRRHLTPQRRRILIANLLKAMPEKSDRMIAETVNADHKTVAAVRSESEARGEIPHVEKRADSKGRQQLATKPAIARTGSIRASNTPQKKSGESPRKAPAGLPSILSDEMMASVFGRFESSHVTQLIVWAFRNRVPAIQRNKLIEQLEAIASKTPAEVH